MGTQTVGELFGDMPGMEFDWKTLESPDPSKIWANYDDESDSFIVYITGKPLRGVLVWIGDDTYVIVDSARKAIGLYVEYWERNFIPAHTELSELWEEIKPNPIKDSAWISLMRLMALWIVLSVWTHQENNPANLQPA